MLKGFLVTVVLLISAAQVISAENTNSCYTGSEEARADELQKCIDLAKNGDASAQYFLWRTFEKNAKSKKDLESAMKLLLASASQGYTEAEYDLGLQFEQAGTTEQHSVEAAKWYLKAANKKHASAMNNLGKMYQFGNGGLEKSTTKAVELYLSAAEKMNVDAVFNLGIIYTAAKEQRASYFWFSVGSLMGDKESLLRVEQLDSSNADRDKPEITKEAKNWVRLVRKMNN